MSLAVYEHHTEIAMLLVHRGAEVNILENVNQYHKHAMQSRAIQSSLIPRLSDPSAFQCCMRV